MRRARVRLKSRMRDMGLSQRSHLSTLSLRRKRIDRLAATRRVQKKNGRIDAYKIRSRFRGSIEIVRCERIIAFLDGAFENLLKSRPMDTFGSARARMCCSPVAPALAQGRVLRKEQYSVRHGCRRAFQQTAFTAFLHVPFAFQQLI